jgi:hypothetical protein
MAAVPEGLLYHIAAPKGRVNSSDLDRASGGCADRRIMFNAEQTQLALAIQSFVADLRGQGAADG